MCAGTDEINTMANDRNNLYPLTEINEFAELKVSTYKHPFNKQLVTVVTVHLAKDNFQTHKMALGTGGGDYRQIVIANAKRATQKAIDSQHAEALEKLSDLKQLAIDFYTANPWSH